MTSAEGLSLFHCLYLRGGSVLAMERIFPKGGTIYRRSNFHASDFWIEVVCQYLAGSRVYATCRWPLGEKNMGTHD